MWIVAVTAGRWQINGIQTAKRLGYKVIAIDSNPSAEGFQYADLHLVDDLSNHLSIISQLFDLHLNLKTAISFASEAGLLLAAQIRHAFSLPGPSLTTIHELKDKSLQRKKWIDIPNLNPPFFVCYDQEDVINAVDSLGFPFIIKPLDSSGSRGVTKVDSQPCCTDQLYSNAVNFSRSNRVIVEKFLKGDEYIVELFFYASTAYVLSVIKKIKLPNLSTVSSCLMSVDKTTDLSQKLISAAISAYEALNYTDGPAHAELIASESDVLGVVEVAGRGGGFLVFDKFVPMISGVDYAELTILNAVSSSPPPLHISDNPSVLMFIPTEEGVLQSAHGFDVANQLPNVEVGLIANVGERTSLPTSDGDRLAWILSSGATSSQAYDLAVHARSFLNFSYAN